MNAQVNRAMLVSIILVVAGWFCADRLPGPAGLLPELREDPRQVAVTRPSFEATVGDITYTVRPLYEYDISGLVVSLHDADSWWDWIHRAANDRLNVMDLCVIYGQNARTGAYQGLSYSSGEFECNFSTRSSEKWQAFYVPALSNNHLLTDQPGIARTMRGVHIGDQVRIHGYLSEYSHHHGFNFFRGTSTTRFDTGNGACETIFVDDVQILRSGGYLWRVLMWVGVAGMVLSAAAWFVLPPEPV
jgi:hypothetical protein